MSALRFGTNVRLYVETMDAWLVEFDGEGNIKLEGEGWRRPSLQERRAIIHAARGDLEILTELVDQLESDVTPRRS